MVATTDLGRGRRKPLARKTRRETDTERRISAGPRTVSEVTRREETRAVERAANRTASQTRTGRGPAQPQRVESNRDERSDRRKPRPARTHDLRTTARPALPLAAWVEDRRGRVVPCEVATYRVHRSHSHRPQTECDGSSTPYTAYYTAHTQRQRCREEPIRLLYNTSVDHRHT